MNIDSEELKQALIKIKDDLVLLFDRARQNKVKDLMTANISVIESILLWIHKSEQKGGMIMTDLKLGEITRWEPSPRTGGVDEAIINDSKALKRNFEAIKVTTVKVPWTTFANRTYVLRGEGKINEHIVPRRDKEGVPHLVYLDEPQARRGK